MMTKRSNHMPTLTRMEITNSAAGLVRTSRRQRSCGTTTLQVTIVQKAQA